MDIDGIKAVKLTRSSKKRVLRHNAITSIANRPRLIKKRIVYSPPTSDECWYYTRGSPPTVVKYNDRFMLSVGYYYRNPASKGSKSNPRLRARSIDARFNNNAEIPNSFETQHAAKLFSKKFRRHVENVVRGRREKDH